MTVPLVSPLNQLLEIHTGSFYCKDIFQTLQIQYAKAGIPQLVYDCCRVPRCAFQATFGSGGSSCKRCCCTQSELQVSDTKEHTRPSTQEAAAQIGMLKSVSMTTQLFSQKPLSKTLDEMIAKFLLLCLLSCSFPPIPYLKVSIYLIFRAALAQTLIRSDTVTAHSELQQVTFRKLSS